MCCAMREWSIIPRKGICMPYRRGLSAAHAKDARKAHPSNRRLTRCKRFMAADVLLKFGFGCHTQFIKMNETVWEPMAQHVEGTLTDAKPSQSVIWLLVQRKP